MIKDTIQRRIAYYGRIYRLHKYDPVYMNDNIANKFLKLSLYAVAKLAYNYYYFYKQGALD